jgi:hypothetical protein
VGKKWGILESRRESVVGERERRVGQSEDRMPREAQHFLQWQFRVKDLRYWGYNTHTLLQVSI